VSALLHIELRIFLAVTGLFLGMFPVAFSHLDMIGLKSFGGWKLYHFSICLNQTGQPERSAFLDDL